MVKKSKRIRSKIAEIAFVGEEPEYDGEMTRKELGIAYNWYNYFYSIKETRKWITHWMIFNGYDIDAIKIISGTSNTTLTQTQASQARMMSRGASNTDIGCQLIDRLDAIIAAEPKKPHPRLAVVSTENVLIADLEDVIDVFILTDNVQGVRDVVHGHTTKDIVAARNYYMELYEFQLGQHPQSIGMIAQLLLIVDALGTEKINTKRRKETKPRKPRAKKFKPASKIVEKVKYAKESSEYNVVSIDPTKILKANVLFTFNTKYRVLTKYVAVDGKTFDIKGTTVLNYDETKSFAMRLRKPNQVLPKIVKDGKRIIDRMLNGLTTKKLEVGNRINKNHLILRSF